MGSNSRASALSSELRAEVERRLNATHHSRINQLAQKLEASLQSPYASSSPLAAEAASVSQPRLADVFDDLLQSDHARRMHQLTEEIAFRDREVARLKDNLLERAHLEAAVAKEQRDASQAQVSKASSSSSILQDELRKLQKDYEALSHQVQSLSTAKSTAERTAASAEARAASAEALLAAKGQDLQELQTHYKQLVHEQQIELDATRRQLEQHHAEREKQRMLASTKEQELAKEIAALNSALVESKAALAAEHSSNQHLQARLSEAADHASDVKKHKKQLQNNLQELERLLAESENERKAVRAKYISLGDKVESMLQEEAAAKDAFEQQVAALKQELQECNQRVSAANQQREEVARQLQESQQQLAAAEAQHRKAVRKLDKKLVHLAQEFDVARQELMIKSAEIMDLLSQIKENEVKHETELAAADEQASALRHQLSVLEHQLEEAKEHETLARKDAALAAEDRMALEMRQQQLRYERQIQELELQNRYISALDAISSPNPAAARRALDQNAGADDESVGRSEYAGPLDSFDARLRRTLAEHVNRAESAQALEAKIISVKKELSADYKRRLETMEAEWQTRSEGRLAEAEATYALKMQQLEIQHQMEHERLQMQCQDLGAVKTKLEEQLNTATQELMTTSKEASQLRIQLEEIISMNNILSARLDEANRSNANLQSTVAQIGTLKTERDALSDLMSKLEQRTSERNEAMQVSVSAEARLQVAEGEKHQLLQRQQQMQQSLETAEAARTDFERLVQQAQAEQQQLLGSVENMQGQLHQLEIRLQQSEDEKQVLIGKLAKAEAARFDMEQQLADGQAELKQVKQQLREVKGQREELEDVVVTAQKKISRIGDEKHHLEQVHEELQSSKQALQQQVQEYQEDQRRMSVLVQGLELSKEGLQKRLSWYEERLSSAIVADPGQLTSSPSTTSPDKRYSSFAFGVDMHKSPGRHDTIPAARNSITPTCYHELERVIDRFEEERRGMALRHEALMAENHELKQRLQQSSNKVTELNMNIEKLRETLQGQNGLLQQEARVKGELAERVMNDAQRSTMDLHELTAALSNEVEVARSGQRQSIMQVTSAQNEIALLQAQAVELQQAVRQAHKDAESEFTYKLDKIAVLLNVQLDSLRSKLSLLKDDVKLELSAALQDHASSLQELNARWHQQLQSVQSATKGEQDKATEKHVQEVQQMQSQLAGARAESAQLGEQLNQTQTMIQVVHVELCDILKQQGVEVTEPSAADVAAIVQQVKAAVTATLAQLATVEQERQEVLAQNTALAMDLTTCATNLQSLVATVAFNISLPSEIQHGLNAKDQSVFDAHLQALHEGIAQYINEQRQHLLEEVAAGPVNELQQAADSLTAELDQKEQTIRDLRAAADAELAKYDEALVKCRKECTEGAEVARQESLIMLKSELQQLKVQLQELQDQHTAELVQLQESNNKQVQQHVKTADRIVRELEATASALQTQLASEVERADNLSTALKRLQQEQEHKLQLEARKERRQTGDIENLRTRLRDMEARDKEKEDEIKQLKRSLRQKELSLLGNGAGDR